ncbi:MAG TPA: NAD-dependent protein deacetylase [Rhodanobacteraceae bacterium]|nr:NAD-dependent protein deacetylase [Rhodanobacteraceae bacterium]
MAAAYPLTDTDFECAGRLRQWLRAFDRIFVLTGAGISTASGIPDYRGPDGLWKRSAPITYQAFIRDPAMRRRYWMRSFVGWPAVARARPNGAHEALVELESRGRMTTLVTQNVDGLHARAGQRQTIDLHGRIDQVICLDCGARVGRLEVQQRLGEANPEWTGLTASIAPDGDADFGHATGGFRAPHCIDCGGLLKPDVVFFGENVPRERVAAAHAALRMADAMLVVGSSLMVYSGYRFARLAHDAGIPLAMLTRGITRADELASLKLDADCVTVLGGAIGGNS